MHFSNYENGRCQFALIISDLFKHFLLQEVYWRIPAAMSPDQLNKAASALEKPTGGVADVGGDSEVESDSDGELSADTSHMTNGHDVNKSHVTNDDDVMQSSSEESERELTKAEVLAELRRRKGKREKVSKSSDPAPTGEDGEKGKGVCMHWGERILVYLHVVGECVWLTYCQVSMYCTCILWFGVAEDTASSNSGPRLTRSGSFFESDEEEMEGESSPLSVEGGRGSKSQRASSNTEGGRAEKQLKTDGGRAEKQLKRVRLLEDDDSSDDDGSSTKPRPQDKVKGQCDTSVNQPAPKKMRKWVDSDSEAESSSEGEESPEPTGGEKKGGSLPFDDVGVVTATGGEESDSDEDGELKIDLNRDSERESEEEEEMEGIRSPVKDTVELLEGKGEGETQEGGGEEGSLGKLEVTETMSEY